MKARIYTELLTSLELNGRVEGVQCFCCSAIKLWSDSFPWHELQHGMLINGAILIPPPYPRGPSGAPLLLRTSSRARALPGQSTRGRARGAVAQRIAPSVKCTSCRAGEGAWGAGMRRGWGVMVYGVRADATCGGASG